MRIYVSLIFALLVAACVYAMSKYGLGLSSVWPCTLFAFGWSFGSSMITLSSVALLEQMRYKR